MRFLASSMTIMVFLAISWRAYGAGSPACIPWQEIMAEHEMSMLPQGKTITIQSLENHTERKEDDWLKVGLRDFLADLLKAGNSVRVLAGFTAQNPHAQTPDMIITGLFQHTPGLLRVFLAAQDNKGTLLKQFTMNIPYPDHRAFFTAIADTSTEILKIAESGYRKDLLKAVRDATSSTRCYENYARGRQALEMYDIIKIDEVMNYFQEAKKADYRSPLGYQGTIDTLTFQALALKQARKPFSSYLQSAEVETQEMLRLVKPELLLPSLVKKPKPEKKKEISVKLDNRFLLGHALFVEGLHASQEGHIDIAAKSIEESLKLVPEDAMGWYHLSELLAQQGKRAAAHDAWKKAHDINPCLEETK